MARYSPELENVKQSFLVGDSDSIGGLLVLVLYRIDE